MPARDHIHPGVLMLLCVAAAGAAAQEQVAARPVGASSVTVRGGGTAPTGTVRAVDLEGVSITLTAADAAGPPAPGASFGPNLRAGGRATTAGVVVLSWDRVAAVEGGLRESAAPFMPMAEKLWRARARLDRGDYVGAEPLFEEEFPQFVGGRGATAVVAAGGLLRCRLADGAQTGAVVPWLTYLNALDDTETAALSAVGGDLTEGPIVDAGTGLAPSLPPIWVNLPSVQSLARGPWPVMGEGKRARVASLAELYEQAARFEAGMQTHAPPLTIERDDGVALVHEIVVARIGDDAQREGARKALLARLKKHPPAWIETWCHAGIGRSLLRESSRDSQLLGLSELVELPARLERVNPYLTGLAMAESAVVLVKLGDVAGAVRLRNELTDRFPSHPALEWEPVRGWSGVVAPAPVVPAPAPPPAPASIDSTKGGPS